MTVNSISMKKRILITQLLCVVFAIISEVHTRLLIANDWLFSNATMLYIEFGILIIIFALLIYFSFDGKWINILLISMPYIIYWFIVWTIGDLIYPTHTDPNDYGVGLLGVFVTTYQWISIVISSIIGTYLKKRYRFNRN